LTKESQIHFGLNENQKLELLSEYFLARIIVQITHANDGSLIEVSEIVHLSSGTPTITGSLNTSFTSGVNPFILAHHQIITAPSGSIQSFQILFSSSFTKNKISLYLAVNIWLKYLIDTSHSSQGNIFAKFISLSLNSSSILGETSHCSIFSFSATSIDVLTQRAISLVTLSQPNGITAECFSVHSS
jgi:hypothetical protein